VVTPKIMNVQAQRHQFSFLSTRLRRDLQDLDVSVHPQFNYDEASQYGILQVMIYRVILHIVFHPAERSHQVYPFHPPEIRCVSGSEWLPSSLLRRYPDGTIVVDVDLLREWTPTIKLKTLVDSFQAIVTQPFCGIRKRCSEEEDEEVFISRKKICYGLF